MSGGPPTIDLWDLKPGAPTAFDDKPVDTSVSGVQISPLLPKVAERPSDGGWRFLEDPPTLTRVSGETAGATILLVGALAAAVVYVLTFDEVFAGVAGLLMGLGVYLFFWVLRNRRRRAIQEQLPDGCFQLARSLRAGLAHQHPGSNAGAHG